MGVSYPLNGQICYAVESSYKGGFGTARLFSDSTRNVRIETGDINKELRDISSVDFSDFVKVMEDPLLHVEYVLQPVDSNDAIYQFYTRTTCDIPSLAIQVGVNVCDSSNDAYFIFLGCKAKSFTLSASKGEEYIVAVDFSVGSMYVATSEVSAQPSANGSGTYPYASFNIAGGIIWAGVTGAYVTEAFSITVDNGVIDYHDVGSVAKKASTAGVRSITGTCDISIDDGGKTHFDEVLAGTDITSVILNTGCTAVGGGGKFTLNNGRFDSTNLDLNTGGEGLISSVPFKFKTLAIAAGT
jgi:hypothetical protein